MNASESPGGAPQVPGGNAQETQNQETQPKQDVVSHETFKKVLDEKKSMQERLKAYEAKEREQLEKTGEYQKLYETLKREKEELEEKARTERATFAYTSVASQFRAEAAKLGCKRPDALERLVDLDALAGKVGSNYVVDQDALKSFVEKAAKEHDYLFAKDAPGFRDAPPAAKPPEQMSAIEEVRKAKTQKELDAVLKKHGLA